MRFIAIASVVCASRLIEPKLIAPVAKRLTIYAAGSTSSSGTGAAANLNSISPRIVSSRSLWSLIDRGKGLVLVERIAAHRVLQLGRPMSGVQAWSSPRRRNA